MKKAVKEFTEDLRYQYPLTPDSIVIDCGGYEGNFAKIIAEKYGCRVHVYEPILEHAANILQRFENTPLANLIKVLHAGVGGTERKETFGVKGDQTGIACSGNRSEEVQIVAIDQVLGLFAGMDRQVDLLKLNIEGMEYEVLEALLDQGLTHRFNNIQVQFHNHIPRAEQRRDYIKNLMMMNHQITWDADWIWTNFELK
jgi:FkbM family methyltransferase